MQCTCILLILTWDWGEAPTPSRTECQYLSGTIFLGLVVKTSPDLRWTDHAPLSNDTHTTNYIPGNVCDTCQLLIYPIIYIESRFMLEIWSWFFVIFWVIFHVSIIFTVKTSEIVWHLYFDYYLKCMVPKFQTCWVNWNLYSHVGAVRFTIFHSQASYYM